ncbi:MAG: FKBP-type peptidyl-prolyl cis-trans isomerase [Pseudomonadota bacterium]|nr:FKBP-type peptidyl-prolyl cis-trans isomerase [Pseudomonadota bacterium]
MIKNTICCLICGLVSAWASAAQPGDAHAGALPYELGYQLGQWWSQWQGEPPDGASLTRGFEDGIAGVARRRPEQAVEDAWAALQAEYARQHTAQAERQLAMGEGWRDAYAQQVAVRELESGTLYRVLSRSEGPRPALRDRVLVHYRASLPDGRVLADSFVTGKPVQVRVEDTFSGWRDALQQMTVGSRWELVIPPEAAFGVTPPHPDIPPNATMIIQVELVDLLGSAVPAGS